MAKKTEVELFNSIDKENIIAGIKSADDENIKTIIEGLKNGIIDLTNGEKYQKFLEFKSSLYQYSLYNCILIYLQKPEARYVGSYTFWKKQNRYVKKGEKGIKIFAPVTKKIEKEVPVLDENNNPKTDENGSVITQKIERTSIVGFKLTTVFDVSQTDGQPIPDIVKVLSANSSKAETLIQTIMKIYPKIRFENIKGSTKGYYNLTDKSIVIKARMSKDQTVKTLIHEYAHSKLHNTMEINRREAEVQAESIAYTVLKHFGLDTSEYSFGYIKGWAADKDIKAIEESYKVIAETSKEIIEEINKKLTEEYEIYKSKEIEIIKDELIQNGFKPNENIVENIYKLKTTYKIKDLEEISQIYKNIDNYKVSEYEKSLIENIGNELKEYELNQLNKKNEVEIYFE